jgi:hypothetical protein
MGDVAVRYILAKNTRQEKRKAETNENAMKLENLQHVDQAGKPQRLKAAR